MAPAAGQVARVAAVALPGLRAPAVDAQGQHPGPRLAHPPWAVPVLLAADLVSLPGRRAVHRVDVRLLLPDVLRGARLAVRAAAARGGAGHLRAHSDGVGHDAEHL